jgi:PAS domain S-box-containing protein
MNILDMRTVVLGQLATDTVCVLVLALLWAQNRNRFPGLFLWLLDMLFQTTAILLIVLRGSIPDLVSMGFSNTMVIAGALLGYIGLLQFLGRKSPQAPNYALLAVFAAVHCYFIFIQPSLEMRSLNVSVGLLIFCFQCAWLLLRNARRGDVRTAREVGLVFSLFCAVSIVRIFVLVISPSPNNDFFKSGTFDTLTLLAYQILLILLTFGWGLMVNQRLLGEVQLQEEKFSKAFRSSPYAITLTRLSDGKIIEVNDGFFAITGYSRQEAAGKTTIELNLWAHEDDRSAVVRELSKGNRVAGREFPFRKKSGDILIGLFSADILQIHDQQWILSSIEDITDRKRAEEELHLLQNELEARVVQRTTQLEAAYRELDAFSYSISHDLRAPLRGIDGWSLALLEDYSDRLDDRGRQYLQRVRSGTQQIGRLIDDLLLLARVARFDMHRRPVDLTVIARAIAARLEDEHPDRKIEWIIPPGLTAVCDQRLLEIVVQNLLDNACKFTGPRELARIEFDQAGDQPQPAYFVRDNGVGFDMTSANKLFAPFQRMHKPSEFPGNGIGLAIAQRIIRRHGGKIWAESSPDKGSTFFFTLEEATS